MISKMMDWIEKTVTPRYVYDANEDIARMLQQTQQKVTNEKEKCDKAMALQQIAILAQQNNAVAQTQTYQQSLVPQMIPITNMISQSQSQPQYIYPSQSGLGGLCGTAAPTSSPWINTTTTSTGTGTGITGLQRVVMPVALSGVRVSINFCCADGKIVALDVDSNFFSILGAISNMHQMNLYPSTLPRQAPSAHYIPMPRPPVMEGDFSEDEMELAEGIIKELEEKHVA